MAYLTGSLIASFFAKYSESNVFFLNLLENLLLIYFKPKARRSSIPLYCGLWSEARLV